MAEPLGAWDNAPLAYALAEVRTERIADIKNYQPKLAGRFRDEYPVQRTMHVAKLVATGARLVIEPEEDTAWEFATPDNRRGVMLRPNGLVLHATAYTDSKDFLARLHQAVSVFAEEVPSLYVNRLGLRYIDFVLPGENEEPEAYVDRRLNPDLGLSKEQRGITATSFAIYRMEGGLQLTLRYMRGRGKAEMPPDLAQLSLDPSPLMNQLLPNKDQPTAVVDTDCQLAYEPVDRLNPPRVQEQFGLIYKVSLDAFMAAITDHARKMWGAK